LSADRPNLIFIMTDQQHYKSMGITGTPVVRTPNLDSLGREGVFFHRAFTPTPLCVPSRVCYHTGRYVHANRSRTNLLLMLDGEPDFTQILREAGYVTGLAGKNHCYTQRQLSERFDFLAEYSHGGAKNPPKGSSDYEVAKHRQGAMYELMLEDPFPPEQCITSRITDRAIEFIDKNKANPFHLWLSYPDPHPPYMVAEPYASMYDAKDIPEPPFREGEFDNKPFRQKYVKDFNAYEQYFDHYGPDGIRKLRAIYYGMMTFIDDQVGRLLEYLDEHGLRENTIIVFCTDHGDYTGDHRLIRKSVTLYDSLIHIPMLFNWTGRFRPREIRETMISVIDFAPTLLDLMGLEIHPGMQGKSAADLLLGETNQHRDEIFAEYGTPGEPYSDIDEEEFAKLVKSRTGHLSRRAMQGRFKAIRTLDWKYVHYPNGEGELYDLKNDPDELTNLFYEKEHAKLVEEMKTRILNWLITTEDALPFDPPPRHRGDD